MAGMLQVALLATATLLGAASHVAHGRSMSVSGDCVYSFQVWSPDQDVIGKIRDLEHSCRNSSWQLEQQLLAVKLELMQELFQVRNLSHGLEKSLLEQLLKHVQLSVTVKDVRLELMEVRNENDKLWDAYRTLSSGSSASTGNNQLELPPIQHGASSKQVSRLEGELAVMENFLTQVKSGVSDLKAEWLVIKREVQNVHAGNTQFKMGQNALRDDTVKLKEMIESLRTDTTLLKDQQSELKESHDKVKKTVNEIKHPRDSDWADIPGEFLDLQEQVQELSRQVAQMMQMTADVKAEAVAVALAARNVSSGEISQWLQKLPALHVPPVRPVQIILPRDCHDVFRNGHTTSGVYAVRPRHHHQRENIYCELDNESGWTVFQRRTQGTLSFTRRWIEYKYGFGSLYGEFWLGNELVHVMTKSKDYMLRVEMWDWEGKRSYADYDYFRLDSEDHKYRLHIRGYSGNAGDSFSAQHNDMAFSTEDSDNDHQRYNCAEMNKGGWWYNSCYNCNLNGFYHMGRYTQTFADGIVWFTLKETDWYSLRKVEMKFRPAHF